MNSTTYITLDMQAPETGVIAYAKQNDKLSRRLSATLKDGATSWTPPTGAAAAIRYSKPDGTGGFYDVLEDSSPAIIVIGNVALMTLAEQCVTVPGLVRMELNFYTSAGAKLTSFTWLLNVEASVLTDATIVSSSYYNVLTAQVAQTLQYKNDAASSAQAAAASAALAQQISQQSKGWYATAAALRAAHPTGQNGDWAIVGGAIDTIWVWDTDTTDWKNTHQQTEMTNYYTKSQADTLFLAKAALLDLTHPVGSIYTSTSATEPSTLFGGTWQRIKDRFLLAAGDTYTAGATGGESTHTLISDEIPSVTLSCASSPFAAASDAFGTQTTAGVYAQGLYGTVKNAPIVTSGGGNPHNNMPPYLTVYVWKRTA